MLHVLSAGLLTTVQDLGRWGWQARGVPVAGPMDSAAHRVANALVGNPRRAAALEVTLVGPELGFDVARVVAVAGAEFDLFLDGARLWAHAPVVVPAGSRLRFGERRRGARAYLAVEGGIAVPEVLGSRSTDLASGIGGHEGRPLRAGDRLPLGAAPRRPPQVRPPDRSRPAGETGALSPATVRLLPGPDAEAFDPMFLDLLESAPYSIGSASDRMGFRLDGPRLSHHRDPGTSEATPLGAIQVPPSGQPILLMAGRQTTGGYPHVATAITADIGIAAQCAPGDALSFVRCSLHEAMSALITQERMLMTVEEAWAR